MKKILGGAALAATLLAFLTGCAPRHYEEIHGKVLDRTAESNLTYIASADGILTPVVVKSYYLELEYRDSAGATVPLKLEVDEVAHASCWKGLNFERSEDGKVSCTVPGAENLDRS